MIWTPELQAAARALADDHTPHPHGHESTARHVRSRAAEFACVHPGHVFQPHQIEYAHCLLQRLDTRDSHRAFKEAWDNADQM